jgi:hypothetical protein
VHRRRGRTLPRPPRRLRGRDGERHRGRRLPAGRARQRRLRGRVGARARRATQLRYAHSVAQRARPELRRERRPGSLVRAHRDRWRHAPCLDVRLAARHGAGALRDLLREPRATRVQRRRVRARQRARLERRRRRDVPSARRGLGRPDRGRDDRGRARHTHDLGARRRRTRSVARHHTDGHVADARRRRRA